MLFGGALAAQRGTSSAVCSSSVSAASLKTTNLTNGRKTSHLYSSSSSSSSSSAWTKTRTSSVSSSSLSSSAMRMLSSRTRVNGNGAHFLAIERTKSSSVSNNKNKRLLVVKVKSSRVDPRRVARVQQQMRREIGNMFQNDAKISLSVLSLGRLSSLSLVNSTTLATVADCEVSNDLQVVKVYVSVLGDERGKKNAMKGLQKLEGYVRGKIGSKISLRLTPEVRFVLDESFERGQKVNSILDVLREERERGSSSSSNATKEEMMAIEDTIAERGDDEDEWLEDDEDEVFEEDEQEVVIKPLRRKKN